MRNKIGLVLFGIGFFGICIFGMGLDSPEGGWQIALAGVGISVLIGAVGYLLMDVDEVLHGAGLQKVKESKEIRERKARNRNQVWNAWIATKNNAL